MFLCGTKNGSSMASLWRSFILKSVDVKCSYHHWPLKKKEAECTTIMTTGWLEIRMSFSRAKNETKPLFKTKITISL